MDVAMKMTEIEDGGGLDLKSESWSIYFLFLRGVGT